MRSKADCFELHVRCINTDAVTFPEFANLVCVMAAPVTIWSDDKGQTYHLKWNVPTLQIAVAMRQSFDKLPGVSAHVREHITEVVNAG